MNVVIFGTGLGRPRQINLTGFTSGLIAVAVIGVLATVSFAGGYWFSYENGSGVSETEFGALNDELNGQQDMISSIRKQNEDTLDALAVRIAQLNARIIRLDALGRRLADMADIDDSEFDFDSEPAMGGPEEPLLHGSNVAIPELVGSMSLLNDQLADREAQLWVLENVLMNENLKERVYPQGRPVTAGWISSYFGKRTDPFTGKLANHTGIDFAGKMGADVTAVADGVVTWSGDRYGYGVMVEINHGSGYATRYAHNSENLVAVGDEVRKGQVISRMGKSGRATGPNLHFEVLKNGQRVNPVNFIRDAAK
ncbi:MAG TPA: M23 family metallopeptidase [Woeseiaceae bacterium]|nr:M23 family metallopeptidase [Woeseiaceae bacterium]